MTKKAIATLMVLFVVFVAKGATAASEIVQVVESSYWEVSIQEGARIAWNAAVYPGVILSTVRVALFPGGDTATVSYWGAAPRVPCITNGCQTDNGPGEASLTNVDGMKAYLETEFSQVPPWDLTLWILAAHGLSADDGYFVTFGEISAMESHDHRSDTLATVFSFLADLNIKRTLP